VTLYLAHIVKFQQQYIFFIVPDAVGIFFSWSLKNGHFANNSQSDIICPLADVWGVFVKRQAKPAWTVWERL
jgi:hypothetical protein